MTTQSQNKTNHHIHIADFHNHLKSQQLSDNTIKNYLCDINNYFTLYSTLSPENIASYINYQKQKQLSAKTINRKLSSLSKYNQYLIEIGVLIEEIIQPKHYITIQKSFSSPTDITMRQVEALLKNVKKNESFRDYAILSIIANSGLRVSEVLSLKINKIDFNRGRAEVIGKGNKQREVILNKVCLELIQEYINGDRKKSKYASSSPYVFVSQKGEKLGYTTIAKICKKYSKVVTSHKLRHRFATETLKNGKLDIRQLQQQLGHESLATTEIYTHPSLDDMKESLDGWGVRV